MNIKSGVKGLDFILQGGIPLHSSVLLEGSPGTGKTTLGIQFLVEGAKNNEPGIYLSFEEFPSQIYQDMKPFGWNLDQYEDNKLIRVIGISPETIVKDMLNPDGLFEKLINELGCKRLVLDSLSVINYLIRDEYELRSSVYTFRNILRKKGITSLIITEENDNNCFEHYIFDGVIKLRKTDILEGVPQRTIEILKMRGADFIQGSHTYRLTNNEGVYLVPMNRNIRNIPLVGTENIPTGVKGIDMILGGGIPKGEIYLIDVDSHSNYKYILIALMVNQLKRGDKVFVLLPDDLTISLLSSFFEQYGLQLYNLIKKQDLLIIDQFNRITDKELHPYILKVDELSNEEFSNFIQKNIRNILLERKNKGENWLIIYDMNAALHLRGEQYIKNILPLVTSITRGLEFTSIRICNTRETSTVTSEQIKRKSTGIIKIWSDSKYQYVKVDKSPNGFTSRPYIMEEIEEQPYFKFV
ncbi:hypothetical protein IMZ08_02550 [Bacillus luteolus]|uniref:KaiC domain-containing protein n=1 Tax=Litchfieldia luteola TaxID=682179 RepID=A0ABR9QEM1_9BACI|nr:ATPase domain-containing protein [Cytobacillus luteolus]MBE4906938.1 hypothetical protein [Cytobacillus luteolus]MBP1943599.1 circadian clock protein KaiC [Cytobacillus luteolus]